jgi:hypothetical protein
MGIILWILYIRASSDNLTNLANLANHQSRYLLTPLNRMPSSFSMAYGSTAETETHADNFAGKPIEMTPVGCGAEGMLSLAITAR